MSIENVRPWKSSGGTKCRDEIRKTSGISGVSREESLQGAFYPESGQDCRRTVTWANDKQHVKVVLFGQKVQMRINED